MRKISLRSQVIIIVMILTVGLVGATIYITDAMGSAKESIVRLNRNRLSSLHYQGRTSKKPRYTGGILFFTVE
ncbi:MAG: hypothetical protein HY088_01950 [Ignavibacteriales bacterium]|nr:hypothetical protein [Ignavibacteriales bacterium]